MLNIDDITAQNKTIELVSSTNYGNEHEPIFISAEIERHSGDDYTVYLVEERAGEPFRFHAIYNDFEAFEHLLAQWESSDDYLDPAALRDEIDELREQFDTAVQMGHGSWHHGTTKLAFAAKKVSA